MRYNLGVVSDDDGYDDEYDDEADAVAAAADDDGDEESFVSGRHGVQAVRI